MPVIKTLIATSNYDCIRKEQEYRIIEEGYDWYKVKTKRGLIYADKHIFREPEFRDYEGDSQVAEWEGN